MNGWLRCGIGLGIALLAVSGCEESDKSEAIVQAYLEAHNSHDITRELSFLTDDCAFIFSDGQKVEGLQEMQALAEWDAVLESTLEMSEFASNDGTVVAARATEHNLWFNGLGIEKIVSMPGTEYTLRDGKISKIAPSDWSEESREEFTLKFRLFMRWARDFHPNEIAQVMPDGKFTYTGEAAQIWLDLFDQWQPAES